MRFPNPVAVTCLTCGRPTVMAETALGAVRVHCGTWRWQCDARRTSTEQLRNIWMIHHCEGLPLGLEAGDHLTCIHAGLDDL